MKYQHLRKKYIIDAVKTKKGFFIYCKPYSERQPRDGEKPRRNEEIVVSEHIFKQSFRRVV